MKKLILSDFDGVWADSFELFCKENLLKFHEMGLSFPATPEDYLSLFEGSVLEQLRKHGATDAQLHQLWNYLEKALETAHISFFPGAYDFLERNQLQIAIISSNHRKVVLDIMQKNNVSAERFVEIQGGEIKSSKTQKMLALCAKYAVQPQDTLYLCDTIGDVLEARCAGVPSVGVAWGWHGRARLSRAKPDYLIENFVELAQLISAWSSKVAAPNPC